MTEAEFRKHLEAAEKSPKEIAAAVSGLSETVLRYQPAPDKWCVLEILGHLADMEIVLGYRLARCSPTASRSLRRSTRTRGREHLNYLDSPPAELIAFYGIARHHNLRLLRGLKPADLSKSAFHPEMQHEMTVADIVARMGVHGANHLEQIEKLKKMAGISK